MKTCSIDGCTGKHKAYGWCNKHYQRWCSHGDPHRRTKRIPFEPKVGVPTSDWEAISWAYGDRFTSKIQQGNDCWPWIGNINRSIGYGQYYLNGKTVYPHRLVVETVQGPIPQGMVVDHICHNRACVNPDHLRVVTNKQNLEHQISAAVNNGSSGLRGVTWNKKLSKWQVSVHHNGRMRYGGVFNDLAEAELAAVRLRLRVFTHSDADVARLAEIEESLIAQAGLTAAIVKEEGTQP